MSTKYLKCRNAVMTYMDPESHFKVPRGRIVSYEGSLTRTMQKWIRRGGLVVVDEAQYLAQSHADPSIKTETVNTPQAEPVPETKEAPITPTPDPVPIEDKPEAADESEAKSKKAKKKSGGSA
jgi:cell division protein FtsN